MRRLALACLALLLAPPGRAERFTFVAFGDMPYCREAAMDRCPEEERRVVALMAGINAVRPAFSLFLGDTQGGSERCDDARLLRARGWMGLADHPLVYTPGDNEWTDCWRDQAAAFDPLERLAFLRARYFAAPESLGRRTMPLRWQAAEGYPENALWTRQGVVFATVHVAGSNNNRPTEPGERPVIRPPAGAEAEYAARNAANLAWLEAAFAEAARVRAAAVVIGLQADMFYVERCGRGYSTGYRDTIAALGRMARGFGRPVLLLNGDSHFFLQDRPIAAAPNLRRVMVPGAADIRAVRVDVDTEAPDPWRFGLIGPDDRAAGPSC